ncbi:MAG TPA: YlxR family protein [Acidimicrobiia bacterium]|nr:YlxR family protein [Acidimicrobiia bacterium]
MPDAVARRHIPERTCIGCRRKTGPSGLVRIVRRPDGSLAIGQGEPGRGAWLCTGSAACFDAAVRRRAFGRALRCEVPAQDLDRLRERLVNEGESAWGGPAGRRLEGVGRA